MERLHRSSCLQSFGRSRFFVPSRLLKVVVCNDRFETKTMKRLNEFVPTYADDLVPVLFYLTGNCLKTVLSITILSSFLTRTDIYAQIHILDFMLKK
jgi:hypothetical protein